MTALLTSVVLGVIFAFFSTQNTGPISLNFGEYTFTIPTYLAILVPTIIALTLAYFFHIARDLSQKLTISEQKDNIRDLKKQLAEVTKIAHKYQLESTKLKSENSSPIDDDSI